MEVIVRLHKISPKNHKNKAYFGVINEQNVPEFIKNALSKKVEEFYDFDGYKTKNGIDLKKYTINGKIEHDGNLYWVAVNDNDKNSIVEVDPTEIPVKKHKVNVLYYQTIDEVSINEGEINYEQTSNDIIPFIWDKHGLDYLSSIYFTDEGKTKVKNLLDKFEDDVCFVEIEKNL